MKKESLIPRRAMRKITLVALALCAAPAMIALPAGAQDNPTRIVFASGPDDTDTVQRIVDDFNALHDGRIAVTWRQMDRDNNAHHDQLITAFTLGASEPQVIASDVVWTAEFAKKGWVRDLTEPFYDAYDRDSLLAAALASATWRLRIWGVPWYTDASMLFYRRDLLEANGFEYPPRTWDELAVMARDIMQDSGIRHGFVFQGADYEGGTANAVEYIWGAGGEVMRGELRVTSPIGVGVTEMDEITVNSRQAAAGLDAARRLIADGIAPGAVAMFREREALDAFLAGDAVFLRSWPYVQGILAQSSFMPAQVGVSWLPAASGQHVGYSCLGGWNLMVNARAAADEREAAWEFIRYLTAPAQQKRLALGAGLLPVRKALYENPEIVRKLPVAALARDSMSSRIRVRPMSPFYSELSSRIAEAFHRVLQGEITGTEAVAALEEDLRAIAARNR